MDSNPKKTVSMSKESVIENIGANDTDMDNDESKIQQNWNVGDEIMRQWGPNQNIFYEGTITKVDNSAGHPRYFVHYKGWNAKYDETFLHEDALKLFRPATEELKQRVKEAIKEEKNKQSKNKRSKPICPIVGGKSIKKSGPECHKNKTMCKGFTRHSRSNGRNGSKKSGRMSSDMSNTNIPEKMPLPHLTCSLCRDENTSSGPFSSLDKLEQHLISQHIVKSEIEIDDEEQTEVKQERGQTCLDDSLEFAWLELEQTHNELAIDQTSPEAVSDPCHSSLPVCQPTLSSLINQLFGISEESIKEQEIPPNDGLNHLASSNLYSGVVSSATMDNGYEINTTDHFHATFEETEQNLPQCSEDNSLVTTIVDGMDQQHHGFGENLDDSEMEDDVSETLTSNTRARDSNTEMHHKCKHCHYATNNMSCFTRHVRIHTGEKPFKCRICKYTAAQRGNLIRHIRSHTGEKPYKCHFCEFATAQKSHLTEHSRSHTGEKLFKCRFCTYATAKNCHLIQHNRIHTEDKPYKCRFCKYATAERHNLIKHIRIHTGEKPFKCRFCKYTTAQSSDLIKHNRIHTGDKPYKCSFCQFASSCNSNLSLHMRRNHKDALKDHAANSNENAKRNLLKKSGKKD